MLEYNNNILCVQAGWFCEEISSKPNYDYLKSKKIIKVIRRGCKGTPALIDYESIPDRFKNVIKKYVGGDPYKQVKHSRFEDQLKPDVAAAQFYSTYKLADGRNLPEDNQRQYQAESEILNAIHVLVGSQASRRRALGGKTTGIWQKVAEVVHSIDVTRYPHKLPTNERRLKQKYNSYAKGSYQSLISKHFGNDRSRKVNVKIERLLLSLYCLPNKPYANEVYEKYMQFLSGAIDVVDIKTGELFNREDFYEDDKPITISEATVWNYLNDPKNRVLVDKNRSGALEFSSTHRPHHHRHAPKYSLSKVSLDDRDLPRKMHDGKRVKAYYAYDVTSGCVIGASYSKTKDKNLFIDCLRTMFRFIKKQNLGMPMEVEVEHHLVNTYRDDMMKAGVLFPFVRWANPGNAQEKYAETMNRTKKYGYEKRYQQGIGRFYSKLEANRTHTDKVFDGNNDTYKEKTYNYEELVADDIEMIKRMNNDLHPNQKLYKGMSRLEVLLFNVNPSCTEVPEQILYKYIGNKTETAIRRSQYVRVQYQNYQLPSPEILSRLKPNNLNVIAYWLPGDDNEIGSVYLWQGDEFICECKKIVDYNRSKAESTEADEIAYTNQSKYVSEFDGMVKQGKKEISKVEIIENVEDFEDVEVETVPQPDEDDFDDNEDYLYKSINNPLNDL